MPILCSMAANVWPQPRKGSTATSVPLADARAPMDGGNTDEEGQHVAFLEAGVGLEGLDDHAHPRAHIYCQILGKSRVNSTAGELWGESGRGQHEKSTAKSLSTAWQRKSLIVYQKEGRGRYASWIATASDMWDTRGGKRIGTMSGNISRKAGYRILKGVSML